MTNVNPNRWGEPMIRLKGMTINDDLKAGEEVRTKNIVFPMARRK
jgi:hypothetical protein